MHIGAGQGRRDPVRTLQLGPVHGEHARKGHDIVGQIPSVVSLEGTDRINGPVQESVQMVLSGRLDEEIVPAHKVCLEYRLLPVPCACRAPAKGLPVSSVSLPHPARAQSLCSRMSVAFHGLVVLPRSLRPAPQRAVRPVNVSVCKALKNHPTISCQGAWRPHSACESPRLQPAAAQGLWRTCGQAPSGTQDRAPGDRPLPGMHCPRPAPLRPCRGE